jgi:hypothetical protein
MHWTRASVIASGILLLTTPVAGAPPPSLRIVGDNRGCPTPEQIATMLERVLVRTKVAADTGLPGPGDASVSDEGPHFRVQVAGQERSFVDAAGNCLERARHAAVFVALIVDPPLVPEPPLPVPPVPPSAAEHPSVRAPSQKPLDLTFAPVFQVAPAGSQRRTAIAGGVAVQARSKHRLNLSLGGGLLYGALHFDGADATAWWVPIDLTVGVNLRTGPWELATETGPNATVLSILGQNLPQAQRQVRLELGARVSIATRFWLNEKVALFGSADMIVRPWPYVLRIEGRGDVGNTPAVWLGGSVGLTCPFE